MGVGGSTACVYENGRPTIKGGKASPCFKGRGNGLLFRIEKANQWAFYNDSTEYEFSISVTFNEDCDIVATGRMTVEPQEDGKMIATVTVYPTETVPFIKGRINGYTTKMNALAPSDEGKQFCESNKAAMQAAIAADEAKRKKKPKAEKKEAAV